MSQQFGLPIKCNNNLDKIKKILDIHFLLNPPKNSMYIRAKEALAYYILFGYNKKSVKQLETELSRDIKQGYVRTINTFLRKNGYLIKDKNNKHKSYLSAQMKKYRQEFVINNGKLFTLALLNKKEYENFKK